MKNQQQWKSRTKRDLVIEVWEHLDCESIGARELEEIARAVRERFGPGAMSSPAAMARILADEGAELRHAEVLELDAQVRGADAYEPVFRNLLRFSSFAQAAGSLKRLENLRLNYTRTGDREGLRRVRETALKGKKRAEMIARNQKVDERKRAEKAEIAEWFGVWLRQPEIFQDWVRLRQTSREFRANFSDEPESDVS